MMRRFLMAVALLALSTPFSSARAQSAHDVLQKARDAYANLASFSTVMDSQIVSNGAVIASRSRFWFRAPNRFALLTTSSQGHASNISTGSMFYATNSQDSKRYLAMPMPSPKLGRAGIMQYQPAGFLTPFLAGVDPFTAPWGEPAHSLTLGKSSVLEGVEVERVIAKVSADGRQSITYLIGKPDGLIRRAHLVTGKGYSMTETYSANKVNPVIPSQTFTFIPPQGATRDDGTGNPYWNPNLKIGGDVPELGVADTEGKEVKLDEYRGKVVLLDFWATWCGPCVEELPFVKAAYDKYHDQGFEIVGISFDQDKADLDKFIAAHKMPWRQIFDGKMFESDANKNFEVSGIPFTLLIGRDGKIAAINPRMLMLESAVEEALAKPVP